MKNKGKKTLIKKADILWSKIVKNRGCCEICGRIGFLNAHHIVGRKNKTLRHDLRNGVCLCYTCHVGGNLSAHNDSIWFLGKIKEIRPEDYRYLIGKKNQLSVYSDYEKTIEELEEQIRLRAMPV